MIYEILNLPYNRIRRLLVQKEITPIDILRTFLKRAYKVNLLYNSYREIIEQSSFFQAILSQKRIINNRPLKLDSMIISVKDNICTRGISTTSCSKILKKFIPSYDSIIVKILLRNGVIILGKTNMDEFAIGAMSINSYFGSVVNPFHSSNLLKDLIIGGSSGGSACSVVYDSCVLALASDTGGSIRLPSSFSCLIGFKPTYGRISRNGIISFSNSLDQVGMLGKDLIDMSFVSECIVCNDLKDIKCKNILSYNYINNFKKSSNGFRIAIFTKYQKNYIHHEQTLFLVKLKKFLKISNCSCSEVFFPFTNYVLGVYYITTSLESASNFFFYDGIKYGANIKREDDFFKIILNKIRSESLGVEIKKRLFLGASLLSEKKFTNIYKKSLSIKKLITDFFQNVFLQFDIIITTSAFQLPFCYKKNKSLNKFCDNDVFNVIFNLVGLPCVFLPIASDKNNLPLGLQIVSNYYCEHKLFQFTQIIKQQLFS